MAESAVVKMVFENSIAEDAKVEKGDIITRVNGKEFRDILDFKYLTSDEKYTIEVIKKDGNIEEIEIYNDFFEPFGVEFENPLIDKPMLCKNKCIFCFMDQLPPNVRSTMLFKDDDVRLSFLQGNYVTLTNLTDDDINRICNLKVSPINVSVHVTDPDRRIMMLSNPNAGKIMDIMKRFAKADIKMNAQIVLCPGINDGKYLTRTISDLASLCPSIKSVSVVPVGISKHREGLFELKSFTPSTAKEVVQEVTKHQLKFKKDLGTSLIYLADEFYILSNLPIPPYEHYEDFPQIENGVGLIASFRDELYTELSFIDEYSHLAPTPKTLVTGYITYDFMLECVGKLKEERPDIDVTVEKIKNNFFGDKITVTGLICGSDIIEQLKDKIDKNSTLLIADTMLKSDCDVFLDDTTLDDVREALGVRVEKISCTGMGFVKSILS